MQRAARRADGGGFIFQPETIERGDFEMFLDREERGFRRERPIVVAACDPAETRSRICENADSRALRNFRRLISAATKQVAQ